LSDPRNDPADRRNDGGDAPYAWRLPEGQVEANGNIYMVDPRGALVPIEVVKVSDRVQDELARDLFRRAVELNALLQAFRQRSFTEIDAMLALLDEKYGAKPRGVKGNLTLSSFDGKIRVQVAVADHFRYGPELQTAKALVDECVTEWSAGSRPELRALINRAFQPDKEGKVNRGALLSLRSLDIQDERWALAMQAIKDAETVEATKRYVRFASRVDSDLPYLNVSLDLANA
jgi:hypothetical protein